MKERGHNMTTTTPHVDDNNDDDDDSSSKIRLPRGYNNSNNSNAHTNPIDIIF